MLVTLLLAATGALLVPSSALAQLSGVKLTVQRDFIGVGGQVRLGDWTPIRLTLQNQSSEPRVVVCRWLLHDFDGDRVVARRRVTLDAASNDAQRVWLYAAPPVNQQRGEPWTIQVLDAESQKLLASRELTPGDYLEHHETALGVMSSAGLGLEPYKTRDTRHESVNVLRGLALAHLPDRWYGFSALESLIWTNESVAPTAAAVPDEVKWALREWVRRGGHLVIVLPSVGESWTDSQLADMLPVSADQMYRVQQAPPSWLYDALPTTQFQMEMTAFNVDDADRATAVLRDESGRPLVVAGRYGTGRVTLMGVNLADPRLKQMGLPSGRYRVWNTIFGWQNPAFSKAYIESEQKSGHMSRPHQRRTTELGRFMPGLIAMRETAAPALLTAIIVFGLYWLLAGPVAHLVLRRKGAARHSWIVFVAVVLLFSMLTWGGAWVMQPQDAHVKHLSIVDATANRDQVHTHSWLSLFMPEFGRVPVTLHGELGTQGNVLSSPGLALGMQGAGFLDPRTYEMDVGRPHAMNVPYRGTAKQFELDYRGALGAEQSGVSRKWIMPQGEVYIENSWPTGKLSHGLPGPLRDVLVIYCPGDGETPWVLPFGDWPAQQVLNLAQPTGQARRLVARPSEFRAERQWRAEGFLGELIAQKTGQNFANLDAASARVADNVLIQAMEMLSFYSMLPPPNFRRTELTRPATMYQRALGRSMDISHLTGGRRIIVLGFMEQSPLPAPVTADGEAVPSEGWTMLRWVYDL